MNDKQLELITRKAQAVSPMWCDVDPRDLIQELALQWLEHQENIQSYLDDPDEKRGAAKLDKTLTRWAHGWCRRETAAIRGNDDYVRYSAGQIKLMLPLLFSPEAWGTLAVAGAGGRSGKPAHEGGDALATYADLQRVWKLLNFDQQQILFARWVSEDPGCYEPLALELGVSVDVLRSRCSRALAFMVKLLAGKPKYAKPMRRAMTNASAQSQIHHAYDGA